MAHIVRALFAGVVKALDRVGPSRALAGGAPGVIGKIFEFAVAAPVQSLVA